MNSKLSQLLLLSKTAAINVNDHLLPRHGARSAKEELRLRDTHSFRKTIIDPNIRAIMEEKNTIVQILLWTHDIPSKVHEVLHHSLDLAIDQAFEIMNKLER